MPIHISQQYLKERFVDYNSVRKQYFITGKNYSFDNNFLRSYK